jgi:diacylglycerol kinase family enzyme
VGGEEIPGVTTIVQNGAPYTYFARRPIQIAEGVGLDDGVLGAAVLTRASLLDVPTMLWRAFSRRVRLTGHRQMQGFDHLDSLIVRSEDGRPLPLQVDGDYVGEVDEAHYRVRPQALSVAS